jgi:hypothetical protein
MARCTAPSGNSPLCSLAPGCGGSADRDTRLEASPGRSDHGGRMPRTSPARDWPGSAPRPPCCARRCRRTDARPLEDGTGESRHQHRLLPIRRRLLFLGKVDPVADVGKRDPGINPAGLFYQIGASCPRPREGGIRDSGLSNRRCPSEVWAESRREPAQNRPPEIRRFRRGRLREAAPTSLHMIRSDESACLPFRPPMCAVRYKECAGSDATLNWPRSCRHPHEVQSYFRIRRGLRETCNRPSISRH